MIRGSCKGLEETIVNLYDVIRGCVLVIMNYDELMCA